MIDRLVHHAEVVSLKGDSYRLKDRDLGRVPAAGIDRRLTRSTRRRGSIFDRRQGGPGSAAVDTPRP